jgi:hypothetical protein
MARRIRLDLLNNASATGTAMEWPGGRGVFAAEATFGGGSVKLQWQLPNGTWADVGTDTSLTANGAGGFELPNCIIRAAVATATAVYATAVGIPGNVAG